MLRHEQIRKKEETFRILLDQCLKPGAQFSQTHKPRQKVKNTIILGTSEVEVCKLWLVGQI